MRGIEGLEAGGERFSRRRLFALSDRPRGELTPLRSDNLSRLDSANHINVVVRGWKENERQDDLAVSWSAERSRWIKRNFEK